MSAQSEKEKNIVDLVTDDSDEDSSRVYEIAYLVSPNVSEEKIGEVVSRIKSTLETQGAFVLFDEFPRLRQLAYVLVKSLGGKNEKYSNAYFGWVKFKAGSENISSVKSEIEKDSDIIRFLIVKADKERKVPPRAPLWHRDNTKVKAAQKTEDGKPTEISEAEIDKTIEELIAE